MADGPPRDLGDISLAESVEPARWVVDGIHGFAENVGSVIPSGFEAYARIFHPAYRGASQREIPVRWSEIAAANGRVMHAEAQFGAITGVDPEKDCQPGLWDDEPVEGELPEELRAPLIEVLGAHTETPSRCWFCIWEGWGGLHISSAYRQRVRLPHRDYILVTGPITAILGSFRKLYGPGPSMSFATAVRGDGPVPEPDWDRFPLPDNGASIWWPDDRRWCVATEIDFMWTYVAGTTSCLDAILARPEFEALPTPLSAGVTFDSDPINPLPEHLQ
jgi:hypothetical protein